MDNAKAEHTLPDDRQMITGYWKLVAVVQDEHQLKSCDIGTLFEFTDTHWGQVRSRSRSEYDLYPNQIPKAIDTFVSRPDNMVVKGIYELEGNELRLLFHSLMTGDEQARPVSMIGLAGYDYRAVRIYRRSNWRPPNKRITKKPEPLCEPGNLIPKAFLKKRRK